MIHPSGMWITQKSHQGSGSTPSWSAATCDKKCRYMKCSRICPVLCATNGQPLTGIFTNCNILGKDNTEVVGPPSTSSHFGIFDHIIGEGKWYDETASYNLICMCELFIMFWLFYSSKSFLDICKSLFGAALRYNSSILPILLATVYSNTVEVTWHLYKFHIHMWSYFCW